LVDQKGRLGRKQIMMKPDSDHLFNEDLEQLLESLEDKDADGDEALEELFGDSINWEESATNDLYSTPGPAPKLEPEDGDDLESLLLENAVVLDSEAIIAIGNPNFYDSLEDLEAFLEKPTPPAQPPLPDIFESLEAFLWESPAVDPVAAAEPLQGLESLEIAPGADQTIG